MKKAMPIYFNSKYVWISSEDYDNPLVIQLFAFEDAELKNVLKLNGMSVMLKKER